MNPLEEFLDEYGQTKEADFAGGLKSFGGKFTEGIGTGAALAGGAALIGAATMGVTALHNAATKTRDFRSMMDTNPDLHQFHQQDPKMFNQMYTSLRRANQSYAADPIISGTYMRKMMDSPMSAGGFLTDAMNSVPSSQGQFARDIGRTATEGFSGSLKGKDLFHGDKPPGDSEWIEGERLKRTRARMSADPDWMPGGKKK